MDITKKHITIKEFEHIALSSIYANYKVKVVVYQFIEFINGDSRLVAVPAIELYGTETNALIHTMIVINNKEEGKVRTYRKLETIASLYQRIKSIRVPFTTIHESKGIHSLSDLEAMVERTFEKTVKVKTEKKAPTPDKKTKSKVEVIEPVVETKKENVFKEPPKTAVIGFDDNDDPFNIEDLP